MQNFLGRKMLGYFVSINIQTLKKKKLKKKNPQNYWEKAKKKKGMYVCMHAW
jgi:hypothetical protein